MKTVIMSASGNIRLDCSDGLNARIEAAGEVLEVRWPLLRALADAAIATVPPVRAKRRARPKMPAPPSAQAPKPAPPRQKDKPALPRLLRAHLAAVGKPVALDELVTVAKDKGWPVRVAGGSRSS